VTDEITNTEDIIDSRSVIDRVADLLDSLTMEYDEYVEEVQGQFDEIGEVAGTTPGIPGPDVLNFLDWLGRTAGDCEHTYQDEAKEYTALTDLARQGEECGDWAYGEALIRGTHFTSYAEELAEDTGAINSEARWPLTHIDWEAAANQVKTDYMSIDFDGTEYWMRA